MGTNTTATTDIARISAPQDNVRYEELAMPEGTLSVVITPHEPTPR